MSEEGNDDGVPQDNGRMLLVNFKQARELGTVDDSWSCARCGLAFEMSATVLFNRAGQTFCTIAEACAARACAMSGDEK
jgi:hypothetical protein